jgi:hypothetical protein
MIVECADCRSGAAASLLAAFLAYLVVAGAAHAGGRACGSRAAVSTIDEMFDALFACWQAPAGSEGMEITLLFSLRRDGTLIGKPRATWLKLKGDEDEQRAFVASVLQALDRALPMPFTASMGGAIAGRPLAPRFFVPDRDQRRVQL